MNGRLDEILLYLAIYIIMRSKNTCYRERDLIIIFRMQILVTCFSKYSILILSTGYFGENLPFANSEKYPNWKHKSLIENILLTELIGLI